MIFEIFFHVPILFILNASINSTISCKEYISLEYKYKFVFN